MKRYTHIRFVKYGNNWSIASKTFSSKAEVPELPEPGDEMLLNNVLYIVMNKEHLIRTREEWITIQIEEVKRYNNGII